MNILLCTFWAVPHVGGVWNYMQQLKRELEARGHTVDMMGHGPHNSKVHNVTRNQAIQKSVLLPLLEKKLDRAHYPQLQDPVIRFYELERYCFELGAACIGVEGYDIIHAQDIFAARAIRRIKPDAPLVAHVHGSVAVEHMLHFQLNPQLGVTESSPAWKYFESLEHHGASSGTRTVTANQWQKRLLVHQFGVPEERMDVFPYGLDIGTFRRKASLGTPYHRPPGKKVIICPARLVFVKGVDVLLAALGILKQTRNDWVCWIVGDGDQRQALEQMKAKLALHEEVQFLGQRSDVPALLQHSDIFVHSCIQDNQPFSVMEAQVSGIPALVSTAGGLPEMVQHGRTGLISPAGDSGTLANQLAMLLENDGYRKELGRNARQWAERHWSMSRMMERLLAVYERVRSGR
ncbi:glycosyltransferase family 1 protein [Paenibacillus sambharensis]|uniref:Glycosyltransferase family 1 protein n=1 Tax=Paenibacillus sambharensis TaxID=1803190 RepID=A0A2W1L340_9BACL|nr:glycosyltransferase family 4 protein [Paenibacillus sambharensis]PZD93269.1 glycosyltransferase family 1 protein [Paenibacillus sambharensis]